jgi:hypothetical protein
MGIKVITSKQADEIIEKWANQSLQACFAVCFGGQAWYARWLGPIRKGQSGRWIQTTKHTTNTICTALYEEIVLVEDEEFLGIRFRNPKSFTASDFEVSLCVWKQGNIAKVSEALLRKIFFNDR